MELNPVPAALAGMNHHLLVNDLPQQLADRCHVALMEAGRPDLARQIQVFEDVDGAPYVEIGMMFSDDDADDLSDADCALVERAERLALLSLGLIEAV